MLLLLTCTNLTLVPVFTGRTAFSSDAELSCQLWTCIAFFHYYYYIWYSFNVMFSSPCVLIFFFYLTLHQSISHCHVQLCRSSLPLVSNVNTFSIVYRRDNNENNNNGIRWFKILRGNCRQFKTNAIKSQISSVQDFKQYYLKILQIEIWK